MQRRGSYTTTRVAGGRIERLERHAGRLRRDAGRLGLPLPERRAIETLGLDVVRAELGDRDGVLRIEWSTEGGAAPALAATTRPLGPDPRSGRASTARTLHPGPGDRQNTKAIDVPAYEQARTEQAEAGVDEVLLFDAAGRLVEGSRSNLIVVDRNGLARTPARSLGCVEGLGLEVVRGFAPEIREAIEIGRGELVSAAELIATNGVRGAVAIVEVDGTPIGGGRPGPLAIRLGSVFYRI
jgi:D-alanine transaminase